MNNSLFPRNLLPRKRKSYDINGGDGIFETEFLFYSEVCISAVCDKKILYKYL